MRTHSDRLGAPALATLIVHAGRSARRRKHFNLHDSFDDPCQRFLNAMCADSYIRPHRHDIASGVETIVALDGILACLFFAHDGDVAGITVFGSATAPQFVPMSRGVEVPPGVWHTIVTLSAVSVMLELKAGPFIQTAAKLAADFAPEEGSDEAAAYLSRLRAAVFDYAPRLLDSLSRFPEKI
jgi:cupin fold WbuC family metalloprotein